MTKRLALKTEHLTELTAGELAQAGGAAFERYTGNPLCSMSIVDPCVSNIPTCLERCLNVA